MFFILFVCLSLLLFIYFLTINNPMSFKKTELCSVESHEICEEPYSFRCNDEFCAKSEQSCEELSNYQNLFELANKKFQYKISSYIESLKPCKYLKEADICINSKSICYMLKYHPLTKSQVEIRSKNCPCYDPKFTVKCENKKYCGINKEACNKIWIKNKKNNCKMS
jgi:hypothetical protein